MVEPSDPFFTLDSGASKKIIIKVGQTTKIDSIGGKLLIKLG